jgi:hypothetical protein
VAGGSTTVTAHFNATNNHTYLVAYELAGAAAVNPVDQTAIGSGTGLPMTGASVVTTLAGDFAVAMVVANYTATGGVFSAGSGWTLYSNLGVGGNSNEGDEYQIQSAAGSLTGTLSGGSGGSIWCTSLITIHTPKTVAVQENPLAFDAGLGLGAHFAKPAENVALGDSPFRAGSFARAPIESGLLFDLGATGRVLGRNVSDGVAALDSASRIASLLRLAADTNVFQDVPAGARSHGFNVNPLLRSIYQMPQVFFTVVP